MPAARLSGEVEREEDDAAHGQRGEHEPGPGDPVRGLDQPRAAVPAKQKAVVGDRREHGHRGADGPGQNDQVRSALDVVEIVELAR